jgi:parallel beta-helix repeat protein
MKNRRISALMLSLILCTVVMVALFLLAGQPSQAQTPTPRYVAVGGSDVSNNCTNLASPCETVQHAVDEAAPGDVINVATGAYTDVNNNGGLAQVVYIDKSLVIRGGYDAAFLDPPDPDDRPTILDAQSQGRVIFATGSTVSVTLDGLRLTGGNAYGLFPSDSGGGLCAEEVSYVLLRNSHVYSSTADIGGGVYYHRSDTSLLAANEIYSNTSRAGAGIYFHLTGNPQLIDSQVYSNSSTYNGAGVHLASGYYDTVLTGNTIHHNETTNGGGGGGLYVQGTNAPVIYNNRIYSNTCTSQGGGLYLSDSRYSDVLSNTISGNAGDTNGGGVYIGSCDGCTFEDNTISYNRSTGLTGGGIFLNSSDRVTFRDNRIHDNVAETDNGGGLYASSCQDLNLVGNSIYSNHGGSGGGLYFWYPTGVTLASNQVYSNTAGTGGGIHLYGGQDVTLMNNVLWANAGSFGAGIRVQNAGARFLHTTLARHTGAGIGVVQGSLWMTNTVLVSNTYGVWVHTNCTATLANTLWGDTVWANEYDAHLHDPGTSILITGTHNYRDDPAFVDPDTGDWHIGPTSGAIDRGVDVAVSRDMDGEPRVPLPDLGADEYYVPGTVKFIYLPLIARNAP